MYLLDLREKFSAAHALRDYPGICARTHGHNWSLRVRLQCDRADDHGMAMDYAVAREKVMSVVREVDHNFFNDLPEFRSVNPTSEKIAEFFYRRLSQVFDSSVRVTEVEVAETESFSVTYCPD